MNNTVGQRIKELRGRLGITQKEFADSVGLSQTHVCKIEKGKDNPSKSVLLLICMMYDVHIEWITNGGDLS